MITLSACALLVTATILFACSGGKGRLRFDELAYPASTSAFLYGGDLALLQKGRDLEVVGPFDHTTLFWGVGWNPSEAGVKELGGVMNESIAHAGGQGIINLMISTEPCWLTKTYSALLNIPLILPFMPGCAAVSVRGEIVKQRSNPLIVVPVYDAKLLAPRKLPRHLPPSQETTLDLFNSCTSLGVKGVVNEQASTRRDLLRKDIDSLASVLGANAVQMLFVGTKPVSAKDAAALKPRETPFPDTPEPRREVTVQVLQAKDSFAYWTTGQETSKRRSVFKQELQTVAVFTRYWRCPPDSPLLKETPIPPPTPAPEMVMPGSP